MPLCKELVKTQCTLTRYGQAFSTAFPALSATAPPLEFHRESTAAASATGSGRSFEAAQRPSNGALYPSHVKLGSLQKTTVAVLSAIGASLNPARADLVAALGETTGETALRGMHRRMQASTTGRKILEERPRITDATMHYAQSLPAGTFGHAYGDFMRRRNFMASERPPVRFIDDEELAYVAQRSREVHDLWHVLFNCKTTVLGELALKAVEFVQTGMPMTALSVMGASWRLKAEDRSRLISELLPWAVHAGSRSADLMCLYYEKHFEDGLEDVRHRWRIIPAPFER
ncbi:Ubiquinone biosynthesis protein COQ4 homolog, mitochondrial [Coccomyxa sp. Obi]|nr:Ubiquinone biosynthesis protein COQ4 homolog, mitochondrial [Coccomyxa sp. Obi]